MNQRPVIPPFEPGAGSENAGIHSAPSVIPLFKPGAGSENAGIHSAPSVIPAEAGIQRL